MFYFYSVFRNFSDGLLLFYSEFFKKGIYAKFSYSHSRYFLGGRNFEAMKTMIEANRIKKTFREKSIIDQLPFRGMQEPIVFMGRTEEEKARYLEY